MNISVVKITPYDGRGPLQAFATIRVGPFEIRSVMIFQNMRGRSWISLPGQKIRGIYYPAIICRDAELRKQIESAVLAKWEETKPKETKRNIFQ